MNEYMNNDTVEYVKIITDILKRLKLYIKLLMIVLSMNNAKDHKVELTYHLM